jgi:NIMA (never in mitosis gene a)-related kinase
VDGAVAALGGKYRAYAVRHWDADDAAAAAAGGEKDERARDDRGDRAKSAFGVEILSELASVFKKLASDGESCPWRVLHDAAVPTTAAGLLPTRDASLLASALVTLCVLVAASEECAVPLLASDGLDHLLHIFLEYAPPFKHLAGDLLHLVCRLRDGRREVRRLGGVTLVLGSLHAASGDEIALEASLRCVLYTGPHTTALAW